MMYNQNSQDRFLDKIDEQNSIMVTKFNHLFQEVGRLLHPNAINKLPRKIHIVIPYRIGLSIFSQILK